jgi:exodeoxyribonuclease-5
MVQLTSEQQTILELFVEKYQSSKRDDQPMLYQINGPAGTGKTELTRHIIERLEELYPEDTILVCAPTHKACQVLQERLQNCVPITTCHQFLEGKPTYDSKGEARWKFKTEFVDIPGLLIVDEVSMISIEVYQQLEWLRIHKKARILTLGDRCQLPPVLEEETMFYTQHPVQGTLVRNMRNQHEKYNQLLTRLRFFIETPSRIPQFTLRQLLEWLSSYTQVYSLQTGSIDLSCIPREIIQAFTTRTNSVLLAHRTNSRNNTVQKLNQYLRKCIFKECADETFTVGEQIIFTDYHTLGDQVFYTNDRATVQSINTQQIMFYNKPFLVYVLEIVPQVSESDMSVQSVQSSRPSVYYIHKDESEAFHEYQKQVRGECEEQIERIESLCRNKCKASRGICYTHRKEIDEIWKLFHDEKKKICSPIDYAYCLSIHKSQGSTYESVYLFLSDFAWMLNTKNNQVDFFKLLYVGMSRARYKTVVF